ncbi:restriction endonuclease [Rhodococcus sp. KRD162]|uniref:restriction endonuclease n=1 Tax=Rhodococcus sp. KRD162 TaxID=2729725 RepID=UPI0019D2E1D5|nr:restriction endonuclease [Rhodococcus sp. KRD162]
MEPRHQRAEREMARVMRNMGFHDAREMSGRHDSGIDIMSMSAIAQVKMHFKAVGRPALQNLVGARGVDHSKQLIFFSYEGYARTALEYANEVGMALFTFDDVDWTCAPVNHAATELLRRQTANRDEPAEDQIGPFELRTGAPPSIERVPAPTSKTLVDNSPDTEGLVVFAIALAVNIALILLFDLPAIFWIIYWFLAIAAISVVVRGDK